jgi:hypothetical protein
MAYHPRNWLAVAVIGMAALVTSPTAGWARESQTMKSGVAACKASCDKLNKTVASQHACYVACEKYWLCNGRDSTKSTCADGRALRVERAPPGTRPPRLPQSLKRGTPVAPRQ